LDLPTLEVCVRRFLYGQAHHNLNTPLDDVPIEECPTYNGRIRVFPSAVATYFAPSDLSGTKGMIREHIHCVDSWRGGLPR